MTRRNAKGEETGKRKPGGKEFFTGDKWDFLQTQGDLAGIATYDVRKIHLFYDKITLDYVAQFGYEDTPGVIPAEISTTAEIAEQNAEQAAVKFQTLRTVSDYFMRKSRFADPLNRNSASGTVEISEGTIISPKPRPKCHPATHLQLHWVFRCQNTPDGLGCFISTLNQITRVI